ncbi:Serine phosphatase RsbU, regulator of sigma subunit [hydrothermal vent metagenome]|uniref:Serine phosphatase RsbU, regulator of sigma subunit n=1 Tax=hydrothermal vent metagenome TaxID=652676 RepID=A0A3B0Z0C4_9ZZZZ
MEASALNGIKPSDLPSPPQAAILIMRACTRNSADSKELGKLASNDPMLTTELLRVVNTAFFGSISKQITSIPRTVTVLGQHTLRNITLCVAVRDSVKEGSIPGFNVAQFWEDSIRRAVSARVVAQHLGIDYEECFTAGLLQDFGLLALYHVYPEKAERSSQLREQDPAKRRQAEDDLFGVTHDKIGKMLAETWALPEVIANAINEHHSLESGQADNEHQIAMVLHCADWINAIFTAKDKNATFQQANDVLTEALTIDAQQLETLLASIPEEVASAAQALGLNINKQEEFINILKQVNTQLAQANLSYQEMTRQLESSKTERDRLQTELNKELSLAREIQNSLLPNNMPDDFPVAGINLSAKQLSGDFYDYFLLKDGRIYFNLGDVSGKGTHAALLMAKTTSLFRCLGKRVHEPGKLLAYVNEEIYETSARGMFVTMAAGIYNPESDTINLANAGHMPAILIDKNHQLSKIEAQGPPLGVMGDSVFPEAQFKLNGGSLYLFSDGVTEGRLENGAELGMKGLLELFRSLAKKPPKERITAITSCLTKHANVLRDDVTLVLVENTLPK